MAWRVVRKRSLWCSLIGREVEVEFEETGIAGLRQTTGVRSCTAFDPPEAVACQRCCRDETFRRPWLSMPILGKT
jgi:hypothetical protein